MLKLIRLEWKKHHLIKYVRYAMLAWGCLALLLFAMTFLGIANDPELGIPDTDLSHLTVTSLTEPLTSVVFLIFTSVMLATFVVNTYQNKTMQLMFTYPISRKKIFLSKLLAVWIFSFSALLCCKLLLYALITGTAQFLPASFLVNYSLLDPSFYLQILLKTILTVCMGFLPLYVGLAMQYSTKATILSSVVLLFLTQGSIGAFTLVNYAAFPVLLTLLALVCTEFYLYHIELQDV